MSRRTLPAGFRPAAPAPASLDDALLFARVADCLCTFTELYSVLAPAAALPPAKPGASDRARDARLDSADRAVAALQRELYSLRPIAAFADAAAAAADPAPAWVPAAGPPPPIPLTDGRSAILRELPSVLAVFARHRWALLYRGSAHGFGSAAFHARCDGHARTLTIVRAAAGRAVFGGFAPAPWASAPAYAADPDALGFLFNLAPSDGGHPRRYAIKGEKRGSAIFCGAHLGPTFGEAPDLVVCDRCDAADGSFTDCGKTYASSGSPADRWFAGAREFRVAEIEVFEIGE